MKLTTEQPTLVPSPEQPTLVPSPEQPTLVPSPEQLRSLGLLNNQSLLPEWEARLKLHAEGTKLQAEGAKLYAEGAKLWADAVIERFGPRATIEWTSDGGCVVDGKETYTKATTG